MPCHCSAKIPAALIILFESVNQRWGRNCLAYTLLLMAGNPKPCHRPFRQCTTPVVSSPPHIICCWMDTIMSKAAAALSLVEITQYNVIHFPPCIICHNGHWCVCVHCSTYVVLRGHSHGCVHFIMVCCVYALVATAAAKLRWIWGCLWLNMQGIMAATADAYVVLVWSCCCC